MKCPVCGSQNFFLKDPADEYETYEFRLEKDQPVFTAEPQEVLPETETYCNRCSWKGAFKLLK
ncbi:MAG: hypothetical protein FJ135_10790 [Deltaproteobacteria bacterium]|nr:hypothetical protein [Deltaproteobacteria bacterium]